MFGGHFYHAITRKTVAVFGTLFNDITVARTTTTGGITTNVGDLQKVPLAYGPKQKFLSRLDDEGDLDTVKVALKLPRMSFEITNVQYDATSKLSPLNKFTTAQSDRSRTTVSQTVPYLIDFDLNIMAKNQDDALQIMEQILPNFQPTYNVTVKLVDGIYNSFDMPITLQSVTMNDDYEGDFTTRRVIVYTLNFSVKTRYFSRLNNTAVIREINASMLNQNDNTTFEVQTVTVDPPTSSSVDTSEITTSYSFLALDREFTVYWNTATYDSLVIGEKVYGGTSGATAYVKSFTYDTNAQQVIIVLERPDAYFEPGESIVGVQSVNAAIIDSYTVT